MIGQRLDVQSAQSYATAERDLRFPTISALGVAGLTPYAEFPLVRDTPLLDFNVNIPIFNGHLYSALESEAAARCPRRESISARLAGPYHPRRSGGLA